MMRRAYQTDLSDAEWALIEPHLPAPRAAGRPRVHTLREILDAVFFYVVRGGCTWRLLPHDFPPWKTLSTITSERGVSTALGSGCTRPWGEEPEYVWGETHNLQPASSIHRASRPPGWAVRNAATTSARR